ncbi:MAG: serine hydrolase [Lachnospiraceae bacterium]|nr:serine hydrolase [Lachnospiraceae bacterium]
MDLQKFIERTERTGILGVKITQNGRDMGKHLWDDECRRNVYSASKSFTSAAVGIAVREGLLSLDEKLTEAFSEDLPKEVNEYLGQAAVRDLLTMCLGQETPQLMGAQRPLYEQEDWVKMCLAFPFTCPPGTKFVYNNVGPYLAGVLVQRRAGCDLVSYLMPRLFRPLGIWRPTWETDPKGYTFGAGGLFLTLSELHKLGLLYLQEGMWEGKQVVPADWVAESLKAQVSTGFAEDYGYGYLFWGGPCGSFRADGKYLQLSIILRDKNAVISTVAECRDGKPLMDAIFQELYPQL